MLFNSLTFYIFFPIVTALYFLTPHRFRWFLLLAASCYFYMAFIPVYILILFITILIDYFAGIWIERSQGHKKKVFLIISIISTCLVLFVFKYFNFFNQTFSTVFHFFHLNYPVGPVSILLPIGLSFHTFQSLSYVIEVYYGRQQAEHHFGIYALYVMFYPQLVAGPIERPQHLLHQFYENHTFDYDRVTNGLKLMLWGLFKKVVIADRLALFVNPIYNHPTDYTGLALITATLFFAFQIYCDFSGYSDIAIGAAQVMGFKLMDNFKRPYFSKSISEFWKRWHISLSTWFRDYLYISLGGNRVSVPRWYFNLFLTFLVSGLWHGANWTFVIWGALNGFYLIVEILTKDLRAKIVSLLRLDRFPLLHKVIQVSITFSLICFAWIFFRANSLHDALYIVNHLFTGLDLSALVHTPKTLLRPLLANQPVNEFIIVMIALTLMECVHLIQRNRPIRQLLAERSIGVRWSIYYLLVFSILYSSFSYSSTQFIYFQF